jgi:coenzyme F420-dependent glucose-6-phosphate dehydrogenase
MTRIGYHCSHEQYAPSALLKLVRLAAEAGFQSAMCSDHFHPWTDEQGQSGFAWSWLGAALEATPLSFGVVTVPGGWRYHPAIIAQAAATLAEMYPGRFWIAPGSGELLNEHIVAQRWPAKDERNARLLEGVQIIRRLWAGETVTHAGLLQVEEAKLYSLPQTPPQLVGAALSPETAEWMGGWADGLITTVSDRATMEAIVAAFRRGGGEGKPLYLQAQLAFASTDEAAMQGAWEQWRTPMLGSDALPELRTPAQFAAAGAALSREDVRKRMRVSSDPDQHLRWLEQDLELGFVEINLHNVCRDEQERFIEVFGERVVPRVSG